MILYLFLVGYYVAECVCDNSVHCDGTRLYPGKPTQCTAIHAARSTTRTRVSLSSIHIVAKLNFYYKKVDKNINKNKHAYIPHVFMHSCIPCIEFIAYGLIDIQEMLSRQKFDSK